MNRHRRITPHDASATGGSSLPVSQWFEFLCSQKAQGIALPITIALALLVSWCVGLYGYSGFNSPPMYGDYEAQRHWMEITQHLSPSEWYFYDLKYWGLDYPPMTAFHSWACGYIANLIDPTWVSLDKSRGIETAESKLFMRMTVIAFQFTVFVPAAIMLSRRLHPDWVEQQVAIFSILLQPGLILIDNGHFQYNSIMLGLVIWAVYFASLGKYIKMSIVFSCALLFKQMALYFAPPIFFFLLARCAQPRHGLRLFIKLGVAVVGTFAVALNPWITSFTQLKQIFIRVFPVARGLYEDKVANIWCALNVVIKLREIFDTQTLLRLSTVATLVGIAPSCAHLLYMIKNTSSRDSRQSTKLLVYALLNSSLAFFLFSFQVHEKTILLPLVPALFLINADQMAVNWFVQVALFSMYPLLFKDGLHIPYFVLSLSWWSMYVCPASLQSKSLSSVLQWVSMGVMIGIHIAHAFVLPPESLPDLYVVINVLFSCAVFGLLFIYFNYRQFTHFSVRQPKHKTE